MHLLEEKILELGKVYPGNILKVDGFLNHRVDVSLINALAAELHGAFLADGVTKVVTVEASGIPLAFAVAVAFEVPMIYAKKNHTGNLASGVYSRTAYSYTHSRDYNILISKEYLDAGDRVLIVDDFLANGNALRSLAEIVEEAGASIAGAGIAIEKGFQGGGDALRAAGMKVVSLAIVDEMSDNGEIQFRKA